MVFTAPNVWHPACKEAANSSVNTCAIEKSEIPVATCGWFNKVVAHNSARDGKRNDMLLN